MGAVIMSVCIFNNLIKNFEGYLGLPQVWIKKIRDFKFVKYFEPMKVLPDEQLYLAGII